MKDYKRLTEKTKLGTYTIGVENETKMIKRLGELEDLIDRTRFVFLAKGRGNGKSSESVKLIEELAELQEYRQKIEQGRLIELPKKVYEIGYCRGWEIYGKKSAKMFF